MPVYLPRSDAENHTPQATGGRYKLVSDMEVSLLMSNLCYPPLTAGLGRVRRKVDGDRAYPIIHPVRGVGFGIHAPR
jgi:hypothetical protein